MAGFKHKKHKVDEELNLVPIMNLVSILIPFLLLAAQFVTLAVIDSTLPAITQEVSKPPEEKPEKPPLTLTIAITNKGLTILGDNGIVTGGDGEEEEAAEEGEEKEPTVPCAAYPKDCTGPEDYNYKKITKLLKKIKKEYPEEENVILLPGKYIPYEVIVGIMDATRDTAALVADGVDDEKQDLFPFVVIAGGAK